MCTRARRFFTRFNRLELSAPLVEASSGHPEFLGQLIDTLADPHPLYGCSLKLPGISLPSLHWCFLSRRVCPSRLCQFKGSFHFIDEHRNGLASGRVLAHPSKCEYESDLEVEMEADTFASNLLMPQARF